MGCGSSTTGSPPPREATLPSPGEDNHDDNSKMRSRENTLSTDEKRHQEEVDRRLRELQDQREEQQKDRKEHEQKIQKRVEEEKKEREEEMKIKGEVKEENNDDDKKEEKNDDGKERDEEKGKQKEEEKQKQEDEEKGKQKEEEKRKEEEEKKRKQEEEEKRNEEEKRKQEEEEKRKEEEERRKASETEQQKEDEPDSSDRDGLAYRGVPCGLQVHNADLREDGKPSQPVAKPEVKGDLYTDDEFTLGDALGKLATGLDWKRPQEFAESPVLFSEGTTRFDIGQGSAGTCWFLSLVASISERKDLMNQIFCFDSYPVPGSEDYRGMFHCRFWRFGNWEDVYTDDKLPVIYDTQLWGAKSATNPNEMWVALLEKAFAKFHGSYLDVYGGQTVDAFLTLTGGVGERVTLESADPQKLFRRLTNAIQSRAMITCTVPAEKNGVHGLVGAHAYSLTGTATVTYKGKQVPLVRIRNPWGKVEWTGPWSDGSRELAEVPKGSISTENKDDGEFWMSLDDFFVYFSQASICSITPDFDMDGRKDGLGYITELLGEWKGASAAGFQNLMANPRFLITVPQNGAQENGLVPLVVQIIQHMERRKDDKLSIRCDLFQVLGCSSSKGRPSYVYEKMGESDNTYFTDRQHSFRFSVPPGQYMIVPSTYKEGVESDFMIRVFSPCPLTARSKVDETALSMSCDMEESVGNYKLKHCECYFGRWSAGNNAGGQISQDSHYTNPQLVFTAFLANCRCGARIWIELTIDEEAVVINIMQESTLPKLPLGVKVYQLSSDAQVPMTQDFLLEHYEKVPTTVDGEQGKFVISFDVNAPYLIPRGTYAAILFTDQPDEEKDIAVVVKSSEKLDIK
ncbi:LOW QUALITY PROTEIN: calpain-2 catalytic subunit-like [Liolophura sinensis]|uniref:LOW QUALITY PROTEIN: calpain-2 catalytic subunit-like n=1 Tax=Liolophura sinensis TaxID=3198878 RepID=UPI003159942E